MKSKISAIIRTRNSGATIGEMLQCLYRQSILPDEVIVVDSGSTDMTIEIVRSAWPKAQVVFYPNNNDFNYAEALNLGIAAASNSFLLIASSHTMLNGVNVLAQMFHWLDALDAVGVYCHYRRPEDLPLASEKFQGRRISVIDGAVFDGFNGLWNACSLIRRSAWEEHPFDTEMPTAEDQEWASWHYEHRNAATVCIRDLDVSYHNKVNLTRKGAFEAAVVAQRLRPECRTWWHFWRTLELAGYERIRGNREAALGKFRTAMELLKLKMAKPDYDSSYHLRS